MRLREILMRPARAASEDEVGEDGGQSRVISSLASRPQGRPSTDTQDEDRYVGLDGPVARGKKFRLCESTGKRHVWYDPSQPSRRCADGRQLRQFQDSH